MKISRYAAIFLVAEDLVIIGDMHVIWPVVDLYILLDGICGYGHLMTKFKLEVAGTIILSL